MYANLCQVVILRHPTCNILCDVQLRHCRLRTFKVFPIHLRHHGRLHCHFAPLPVRQVVCGVVHRRCTVFGCHGLGTWSLPVVGRYFDRCWLLVLTQRHQYLVYLLTSFEDMVFG